MGGSALGRSSRRLTTPQFDALMQHCISRLIPNHFSSVVSLRPSREKMTHGDIDLLCAYDEKPDGKKIKGEDWGVIVDGEDKGVGAHHPVQALSKVKAIEQKQQKEGAENQAFRDWAVGLAKAIGGTEWKRSGTSTVVISIGVPCRVINDGDPIKDEEKDAMEADQGYEPFFQVDLQMVPERCIDFTAFTRSYSNTVLSHGVSFISPNIKLHGTHLGLKYNPYAGLEPIKLEITSSPLELCGWLGLDYEVMKRGIDNELALWQWATTVKEGGMIHAAWRIITDPKKRKERTGAARTTKYKDEGWHKFLQWLQFDEESPYNLQSVTEVTIQPEATPPTPPSKASARTDASDATTLVGDTPVRVDHDIGTDVNAPGSATKGAEDTSQVTAGADGLVTPLTPSPKSSPTTLPHDLPLSPAAAAIEAARLSMVDPERPAKLDGRAVTTLGRFKLMDQVEAMMKDRKEKAVELAERQKKKVEQLEMAERGEIPGVAATVAMTTTSVSAVTVEAVSGDAMTVLEKQVEKIVVA